MSVLRAALGAGALCAVVLVAYAQRPSPARLGIGTPATPQEIKAADDDVTPSGHGLPNDSGSVAQGKLVFEKNCVGCHGATGVEGPMDKLVGRMPGDSFPFGRDPKLLAERTIGNYWPYATTVYDFIHRAMPQDRPGALTPHETYAVVAYLLYRNGIVPANAVLNARTLPQVKMPARARFVRDDRTGGPKIR
jgi:cytochrome c